MTLHVLVLESERARQFDTAQRSRPARMDPGARRAKFDRVRPRPGGGPCCRVSIA